MDVYVRSGACELTSKNFFEQFKWQNIAVGRDYAFYALPFDIWKNLTVPYDYRSVMHFGSDQLAQYGKTVLHKKDGSTIEPNKDRPTSLDIAKICAAYECNEV